MARLILLIAIIAVGYSLYKKLKAAQDNGKDLKPTQGNPEEPMRKCAKCDVHLPEKEAIQYQTLYFCSEEHKKSYLEQHSDQDSNS